MKSLLDLLEHGEASSANARVVYDAVAELLELDKKAKRLENVQELLAWDQEVLMPKLGVDNRAEQMAVLESFIHETQTHPRVAELLHTLEVHVDQPKGTSLLPEPIRLWLRAKYRQWHKASCYPPALLQEIVMLRTKSHQVWIDARTHDDFDSFAPYLEKTIELQKERANCIGYEKSPYDALLDEFEIGMTTEKLKPLFADLCSKLVPICKAATEKSALVPKIPLHVSTEQQRRFCRYLCDTLGFSENIGRLDESAHPFSTNIGMQDARITTRFVPEQVFSSMFSVLHEMGHAFYDLGIADMYKGTACDDGSSFGIHESQSRFLENVIGRSPEFWKFHFPMLQEIIPVYKDMSFEQYLSQIHYVEPSLIRVESDEVSYGLHIIIRFEIEHALLEGNLKVKDLPDAWAELSSKYLGVKPKTNREGVLQDVHWSEGLFGYFPSYELGNMYSAKLLELLQTEMPEYRTLLEAGSFVEIKEWLGKKIHNYGAAQNPAELLDLSVDASITYLQNRYIM